MYVYDCIFKFVTQTWLVLLFCGWNMVSFAKTWIHGNKRRSAFAFVIACVHTQKTADLRQPITWLVWLRHPCFKKFTGSGAQTPQRNRKRDAIKPKVQNTPVITFRTANKLNLGGCRVTATDKKERIPAHMKCSLVTPKVGKSRAVGKS